MSDHILIDIIGRDRATAAFDSAGRSAERAAGKMDKFSGALTKFGSTMTRRATLPILAIGAASLKTAVDYQKSMTLLQTAGGETANKMKVISAGVQKLATTTGTSLNQLSEGMYTIAKAGSQKWSAVDQLKVLKAAAEGAKAEGVDLGTATNALTSVMMSYHMGASKAVQAENMLIVGAGKAKTTMQEYAGALSTVIPIASANGVKFQEVAAAIATLTQHGTSADEATQELANTIRNLAAPNQVAQKAMQQLGLSVNAVSRNLRKSGPGGGLAGTLDMIEGALAKSSKAGMVVVGAFKNAQSATHDLNVMLGKMPKTLADNSRAFLDGKMSYNDYRKAIKSLGADGYSMGSQFLALAGKAKGFSDVLRNGSPAQQTAAAQLKAMLGGATGLNTALQLGGENATYFHKAISEVASAAQKSGADVLGWAKTSGTLSFKLDQAKSNLQVMALEIGNQLIPVVSKIVAKVTEAAKWFGNLSPSMQHTIVTAALIVAALGPVLTIIGRVSNAVRLLAKTGVTLYGWAAAGVTSAYRFAAGMRMAEIAQDSMATRSYAAGLKMRSIFSAIGTGAVSAGRYVVNAFKTAGTALAGIPAAMRDAEGFAGKLAAIGSGAAGAGAALGPLAAGVVGVGAVVGAAVYAWDDYKAQQQQVIAETNDLTSAIEADSGALGANTRAAVVNIMQKRGILADARTLGLNLKMLTDAYMGNGTAMQYANIQIARYIGGLSSGTGETNAQRRAAALLGSQFGIVGDEVNKAKGNAAAYRAALGQTAGATDKATSATDRLNNALQNLDGGALNAAQAEISFRQSLGSLKASLNQNGDAIRGNSAKALENRSAVLAALQAAEQHAQALKDQGKSAVAVRSALTSDVDALIKTATSAGIGGQAIRGLLKSMGLLPKQITTKIKADPTPAKQGAHTAQGAIDAIKQKSPAPLKVDTSKGIFSTQALQALIDRMKQNKVPGIDANTAAGEAKIARLQAMIDALRDKTVTINTQTIVTRVSGGGGGGTRSAFASGGAAIGPGSKSSDSIPARLSNGEHVWTADEVDKAGGQGAIYRARAMVRAGVLKFAGGGAVEKVKDGWKYDGIVYDSKRAAENARTRAAQKHEKVDTAAVGTAIGNIGSQPGPKQIDVAAVGINRIRAQIAAAQRELAKQEADGLKKSSAQKFEAEIRGLAKEAARQLGALKIKIKTADVSALKRALSGTVQDAQAAFAQLVHDMRAAGVTPAAISRIQSQQSKVVADMRARDRINAKLGSAPAPLTAYEKLANAKQNYNGERDNVKQAVLGGFNIATAGQVYNDRPATASSILASLKASVAKAKTFARVLAKLKKMKLAPTLLSQLAQAGPDALGQAQALASSGAGTIADITKQYSLLNQYAGQAGTTSADAMYGAGKASAQKLVNGLLSQRKTIAKAIKTLDNTIDDEINKALAKPKPHPGKHGGGHGGGHKPTHPGKGGGGHKPTHPGKHGGVHIEHLEINQQKDPVATAQAVTRRLAHLGG